MQNGPMTSCLDDKQSRAGLGIEAHRTAVASYLAGFGAAPIAEFVEVESGKRADRPELARALSDVGSARRRSSSRYSIASAAMRTSCSACGALDRLHGCRYADRRERSHARADRRIWRPAVRVRELVPALARQFRARSGTRAHVVLDNQDRNVHRQAAERL
jgi:hypothetical protein